MSRHGTSGCEAFSRVVIDAQLDDVGWNLIDGQSVRYEYPLPDGTRAGYVLCDRHGRAMAVVEAKRTAVNLQEAETGGYAKFFLPMAIGA